MELSEIRAEIDGVDDQMLALFLRRMELAEEAAAYKADHRLPVLNRRREQEILDRIALRAGTRARDAVRLFSTLFDLARARQMELIAAPGKETGQLRASLAAARSVFPQTGTVACRNVPDSRVQAACGRLLPRGRIVPVGDCEAVVSAVESGRCQFGVLPAARGTGGSVPSVYELLRRSHLFVVRSVGAGVRCDLLALPGARRSDLTEIYASREVMGQCGKFLASLSGVRAICCDTTAAAAKRVTDSQNRLAAVIFAHPCAVPRGLEPVRVSIEDGGHPCFICIARNPVVYDGASRIGLLFSCENSPGALCGVLSKPAELGVNLTKLKSCPAAGRNSEAAFFLELEADVRRDGVLNMLEELERSCARFQFLGAYEEV